MDNSDAGPGLDLGSWREKIQNLVHELTADFEQKYGYSPGENYVSGPATADDLAALQTMTNPRVPPVLLRFFSEIKEVSLEDFWNGYFIGPPCFCVEAIEAREPVAIAGHESLIVVFGRDGGGASFAIPEETGFPVYRLPVGPIEGGVYTPFPGEDIVVVAAHFTEFLEKLSSGLHSYIESGIPGPF